MPATAARPIYNQGVVARAVVKDAVFYGDGERLRQAPRGEYDIVHRAGRVGFWRCAGDDAFTLSLDAFLRHIQENSIALVERRVAA